MSFPLPSADPASLKLDVPALTRLSAKIREHIQAGRYPGAQIAMARHGKLALFETFGDAAVSPRRGAGDDTLWLLFSNTKVITACAMWILAERGAFRFTDTVAALLPGFEKNGKGQISVMQVLSHQGGFPGADVPKEAWADHELMRKAVCDFTLEWSPGSKLHYHAGSAHWVCAALIEQLTGRDFRDFIRDEIAVPLGLGDEMFVGLPEAKHGRAVVMHEPDAQGAHAAFGDRNSPEAMKAGIPGGGGYATARAMAAFYQMLLNGGSLNGVRLISPRMVQYVTRSITGDRVDENMGMPMHRGLGPHVRGTTATIRGLGAIAFPGTFGHGGAGSSYCWADPDSGTSFAYLTNSKLPEPWHTERVDIISTMAHAAIDL